MKLKRHFFFNRCIDIRIDFLLLFFFNSAQQHRAYCYSNIKSVRQNVRRWFPLLKSAYIKVRSVCSSKEKYAHENVRSRKINFQFVSKENKYLRFMNRKRNGDVKNSERFRRKYSLFKFPNRNFTQYLRGIFKSWTNQKKYENWWTREKSFGGQVSIRDAKSLAASPFCSSYRQRWIRTRTA